MADGMRAADQGQTAAGVRVQRPTMRTAGRLWELELLGRVWRFFTSVRLALILILVITAAVLVGTLLMQAPPSVISDSASYDQWLERARGKYGIWTNLFSTLQLFNLFHSLWFRLLLALLTANIIVCTVNRWKGIWTTVFRTRVRMGEPFFEHARLSAHLETSMQTPAAAERVRRAFSGSRYRVQVETGEESVAILADRNRLSRLGTIFSHLSLILILTGVVVGGIWGYSDSEFIITEGATRELSAGSGISVELVHFTDEYYMEGPPKDFRSDLVIYQNGVEVKRDTTHVNSPVRYKGYSFHQSFYGNTAMMEVRDETGAVVFDDGVPLAWQTREGNRPLGSFILPERNLKVYVIGPVSGTNDPMIPAGEMRVEAYRNDTGKMIGAENITQGKTKELGDLSFTFNRETRFTGLKVVKDPGANIIWVASTLMILGLVMLFYLPHRRLWALCKRRPDGTTVVHLATTGQRDLSLRQEFEKVRDRVRRALGIAEEDGGSAQGGSDV